MVHWGECKGNKQMFFVTSCKTYQLIKTRGYLGMILRDSRSKDIVTLTSKIKSVWRKWAMKHWLLHTITSLFQLLNSRIIWLCRVLTLLQTWARLALIARMHNQIKTTDTCREQISLSVLEQLSFVPQKSPQKASGMTEGRTPLSPACA